jgi:hypothetical protein
LYTRYTIVVLNLVVGSSCGHGADRLSSQQEILLLELRVVGRWPDVVTPSNPTPHILGYGDILVGLERFWMFLGIALSGWSVARGLDSFGQSS